MSPGQKAKLSTNFAFAKNNWLIGVLLVASTTSSRVGLQAGRPGIQVAARPNPAVPGGGMPAHRQRL